MVILTSNLGSEHLMRALGTGEVSAGAETDRPCDGAARCSRQQALFWGSFDHGSAIYIYIYFFF